MKPRGHCLSLHSAILRLPNTSWPLEPGNDVVSSFFNEPGDIREMEADILIQVQKSRTYLPGKIREL